MSKQPKKIIFWGRPEFSVPSFLSLLKSGIVSAVVTQPDKAGGRGQKMLVSPIKTLALENNIPILNPLRLDANFDQELKKYLPATFVIVAYGKIIPQRVLDLSELKAINIHPSRLPILRGPSPIQSALLQGLSQTAVTLMQLDSQMDHGPILAQKDQIIDKQDNFLSLSAKLAQSGAALLIDNIDKYLSGGLRAIPQDDKLATYCKLIKKEEGLIDWSDTALNIHNKVRAFNPWPGAFSKINDLEFKILSSLISDKVLAPGKFTSENNHLYIGTGQGSLQILSLQPAGKKAMAAAEFIRGYNKYLS